MIDDNKMYIMLSNIADALRLMNENIVMIKEQSNSIETITVDISTKVTNQIKD